MLLTNPTCTRKDQTEVRLAAASTVHMEERLDAPNCSK